MLTVDRRLESALPPSVPAKRARSARWRDPRLLAGVALVAVAMAGGALLLNRGSVGTPTVRALRDLPVGVTVSDADVEIVTADIPGTQAYLAQIEPGDVVVRAIHAGELVPADALTEHAPVDVRMVTVPVEPLHAPPGLMPGSRVDVWVTSDREGALPELALAGLNMNRLVFRRLDKPRPRRRIGLLRRRDRPLSPAAQACADLLQAAAARTSL